MDLFSNTPADSVSASASTSIVPSMVESNTRHPKTRSACNRCHSQKLRCVREMKQISCKRCLKLKTACQYSPRASCASRKAQEQSTCDGVNWLGSLSGPPSIPDSFLGAEINTDGGVGAMPSDLWCPKTDDSSNVQDAWSGIFREPRINSLDYEVSGDDLNFMTVDKNILSHGELCPHEISDSNTRIEDYNTINLLGISPPSSIRKLANLNVALYECSKQLPSMEKASVESTGNGLRGSRKATLFVVDELFRLTLEFIDTMKYSSLEERQTLSTNLGSSALSLFTNQLADNQSKLFPHIDESTMFMIVSCHFRLTEIYVSLFEMMQACIKHSLAPRLENDRGIILPKLQVGSFMSPPVQVDFARPISSPKTSSIYMHMITMLSSQVWEQLADVMRGDVLMGLSPAASLIWDKVKERTDRLSGTINETRLLLRE